MRFHADKLVVAGVLLILTGSILVSFASQQFGTYTGTFTATYPIEIQTVTQTITSISSVFGSSAMSALPDSTAELQSALALSGVHHLSAGMYNVTAPLTFTQSYDFLYCDKGATIRVASQIDGGIIQTLQGTNSLEQLGAAGCVFDGNDLSMMGIWIPNMVHQVVFHNDTVKNIRGVAGLQTAQNPVGILMNAQGGGVLSDLIVSNVNAPSYDGGNGDCYWLTGTVGITQPERLALNNLSCSNTMNVAPYELINGIKLDVNTLGFTGSNMVISDVSGDGLVIQAGGPGNIANNHTLSYVSVTNARFCVMANANAGGVISGFTLAHYSLNTCRAMALYAYGINMTLVP